MNIKNQKLLRWGVYTDAGVLVDILPSRTKARDYRDGLDNSNGQHRVRRVEVTVKALL